MSQINVDTVRNRTCTNGGPTFDKGLTVSAGTTAYVYGNLQVDGTETIINTETLNVADKTIGIGSTSNASNTTADGAGGVGEKMRLDNTGKLLLGDVNTAWNATSNGYKMTIKESSNENGAIMFMDTDSMAGGVAGVAKGTNQIVSGTSNVDGVFGSFYSHTHLIAGDTINVANAAIRLTVHTEGHVEILDGDLQVASGHGIDFSDTAGSGNSELLNDYEHGNWVPTSASGGWTVSNTYSKYVKIGNLVHLQMYIGLSGTGSSSNLEFGGMPFATAGNGYSVGTVDFGEGGIKGTYMRTKSSSSSLSFLYPSENTSSNRLNLAANQVGDSYVIATITYAVDGT